MKAERCVNDDVRSGGTNRNVETDLDPINIFVYHNHQSIQGLVVAIELDSLELCNCPGDIQNDQAYRRSMINSYSVNAVIARVASARWAWVADAS
jgi:hypothetical protein